MLKINCLSKTAEFVNFEAVEGNNIDEIDVVEEHINDDVDFIDDEIKYDEYIEDYSAFTNATGLLKTLCKILLLILTTLRKQIITVRMIIPKPGNN